MTKSNLDALFVTTWAPPMVGGPQNLYNLLTNCCSLSFEVLTSQKILENSLTNGIHGSWLPCTYHAIEGALIEKKMTQKSRPQKALTFYSTIQTILRFRNRGVQLIKEKRPKRLIGISDTGVALLATYLIHKKTRVPFVIYLFDLYEDNLLSGWRNLLAHYLEKRLFSTAERIIVTNEATKKFYTQKYGTYCPPITIIRNAVPQNLYPPPPAFTQHSPLRIVFTGNVYWAQEQSLQNLLQAMSSLQSIATLDIYAPTMPSGLRKIANQFSNVRVLAAAQVEMPEIQRNADLLFLPLSWNTKAPAIIDTASPGKLTDYLAAARPILVHAPHNSYVSTFVKDKNVGLVVNENDASILSQAIHEFAANPDIGQTMAKNGWETFLKECSSEMVAPIFEEILS